MTPEQQRAPKAYLKVYFDDRPSELSFEAPADLGGAALVELVDRKLMMMFVTDVENLQARIAGMELDAKYMAARLERVSAEEELEEIDRLADSLAMRRATLEKAFGLKSN